MPACSLKYCGARKSKYKPNVSLHKCPDSGVLRDKWLDTVGVENINPRHKQIFICSLHFEESRINRTLEVPRLCENAVPTLFNRPSTSRHMPNTLKESVVSSDVMPSTSGHGTVLYEYDNFQENVPVMDQSKEMLTPAYTMQSTSTHVPVALKIGIVQEEVLVMSQPKENLTPVHEMPSTSKNMPVLYEIGNIKKETVPVMNVSKENPVSTRTEACLQFRKLAKLEKVCEEQRKKIKRLHEKVRRQKNKISTLEDVLADLKQKLMINTEQSMVLEQCGGSQDFLKRQMAKAKGIPVEKKYTEEIRKFALTLHFLSPKAYDYIRRVYNTCLPHPRTLSKWYQNVDADTGFTKEAFDTLKKKVEESRPQKILCALVFDEISIRKGLIWDPKASKYHGRVDYGHHIDCDSVDEANQCLVFILTCINGSWKLPIGYFFITSLTGEQKSLLVETAIKLTEGTGCQVVSVTCDGPATNFSMFAALGCKISNTQEETFFETENKNKVHAFIDPCHAIKLVRNTLGDMRILMDGMGRIINFRYFELLLELQEQQGLHLATKVSKAHIFFEKQKMKVRLATQLLSNSVADALLYCKTELQLEEFQDCEGTVNFINVMNNIFDVLNSHSIRPPGLKKAMCPENIGLIRAFFEAAIDYIKLLKLPSGELLVESRRKTGFLGLIVGMQSALKLYEDVVEKEKILKYIPVGGGPLSSLY